MEYGGLKSGGLLKPNLHEGSESLIFNLLKSS